MNKNKNIFQFLLCGAIVGIGRVIDSFPSINHLELELVEPCGEFSKGEHITIEESDLIKRIS